MGKEKKWEGKARTGRKGKEKVKGEEGERKWDRPPHSDF